MIQPLFKVKVTLAPCKEADDSELSTVTLGNVLVSTKPKKRSLKLRCRASRRLARLPI